MNNRESLKRVMGVLVLVGLLAFGLVNLAQAAEFRSEENLVIAADEVIDDDLFISGAIVEMNGTVKGDLIATGGQVIINGNVEGSVVGSGQLVTINGRVGGSVYSLGYGLTIGPEARIGRNVYFGGFSLTTQKGSAIGRGLYSGSYQAILNGEVVHDVEVGTAALELNGQVGGDVKAELGESDPDMEQSLPYWQNFMPGGVSMVAPGLRIGDEAQVGGDFFYTSPAEQSLPGERIRGRVVYQEPAQRKEPARQGRFTLGLGRGVAQRIGEFIALLIVGGLLLRFWPDIVQQLGAIIQDRPLPSAGWGCLVTLIFWVAVPLAGILIFIVAMLGGLVTLGQLFGTILGLGGATLGLAMTAFGFVVTFVTKAVVAFLAGQLILERAAPQAGRFWMLAVGVLIYEILRAIPILGWLISILVTLVGLGAIYFLVRGRQPQPAPELR